MGEPDMSMVSDTGKDEHTVDIKVILGPDLGSLIDRHTTTVEYSTQHIL
jgi:hypothetical protein